MPPGWDTSSTGHGQRLWPVLLVLLSAVVVPTACVLWFMNAAMRNERLAVRQQLTEAYRARLLGARDALERFWTQRLEEAAGLQKAGAPAVFAAVAAKGLADSAVILNPDGSVAYPTNPLADRMESPSQWAGAEALEYQDRDLEKAADAYAWMAAQSPDPNVQGQSLAAQARCLHKAGRKQEALEVLTVLIADQRWGNAVSADGRLVVPNAQLLAMQWMAGPPGADFRALARALSSRLNDYSDLALPSGQRCFLMQGLRELDPSVEFPTLACEQLAQEYLQRPHRGPEAGKLTWTGQAGLWQVQHGRCCLLFREESLVRQMRAGAGLDGPMAGISLSLLPPTSRPGEPLFLAEPAGEHMPAWQITAQLVRDPFAEASRRQRVAYLWTGGMGILAIALLALALAAYVGRQMRLARLKNDLIATVSHELKTPLSSIRVLVDTLLEGRCTGGQQRQDYFHLIARENERLSRLIDNFLAFSRMERNKRTFELGPVPAAQIVSAAVDALQERLHGPQCTLEVAVPADLPPIYGDRDALITVLLNLLDNAWKYSKDQKRIAVRAGTRQGRVWLEVTDNGIGMTRRSMRRIFDRFYQADRTLSRKGGGCGLGLSIVKFIVDSHRGKVDVRSRPNEGSTFTLHLPAAQGSPEDAKEP